MKIKLVVLRLEVLALKIFHVLRKRTIVWGVLASRVDLHICL